MYLFFLGVILGVGLTLAIRSVDKTLRLRKMRRRAQLEAEIEERIIARNNAWEKEKDQLYGWDRIPSPPRPSALVGQGRSNGFQPIRHP